jgi:uroporphyrinogen-III decarboxylase
MNVRERFHATCRFEKIDRPIYYDALGFWDETLVRWHKEGLPETVIDAAFTGPDYFGFDSLSWLPIAANTDYEPGFWPAFTEEIIEESPDYTIKRDVGGSTVRVKTDGHSTIPQYLDHPVKTLADFEELVWRLDPETPERFSQFLDFMADMAIAKGDETYTCAHCCGLFGMLRLLLGLTGLSVSMRRDPALIHAIARQWQHMNTVLLKKLREKAPVDWVFFFEDMSYKNGPMISPRAFTEFMAPYYRSLIREVKADTDIRVFTVDSDGDVSLLIPLFMETGINMMLPFEVQAGMDVRKVREQYPDLVILGGLDKRALFTDVAAIEREVLPKVTEMLPLGGYIPSIDHNVPPEVSLENFRKYLEILRGLY